MQVSKLRQLLTSTRMRFFLFFVSITLSTTLASLDINSRSLDGTELNTTLGLSDKQVGLFNLLDSLVLSADNGNWPNLYMTNQTGNLDIQRDMTSYRYSLAFSAYATAAKTLTHLPAYTRPAFEVVSAAFRALTEERVWSYWNKKGDCAPFFLTPYCEKHQTSMCDLNEVWHGKDSIKCPDPAWFGNIMFSAHLAHVGGLVRLLAPSDQAAAAVLDSFTLGGTDYSYDLLLDRLKFQMSSQADILGGGITCEPANVYPSCQSHAHAALALAGGLDDADLTSNWQRYLLSENLYSQWNVSDDTTRFGERLFKIAQQTPRHPHIPDFGIPIGCASHDVWVLGYMTPWARDDMGGGPEFREVLRAGRATLRNHPGWSDGVLKDSRCALLAGDENEDIASAMYAVLEAQAARGEGGDGDETRMREAISRFEREGVVGDDKETYYYSNKFGLDVLVTTQLATSMVLDSTTFADLHGRAGAERMRREGLFVDRVEGKVFVRKAAREGGGVQVTLVARGEEEVVEVVLTMKMTKTKTKTKTKMKMEKGDKGRVVVRQDGREIDSWVVTKDGIITIEGTLMGDRDSVFEVECS